MKKENKSSTVSIALTGQEGKNFEAIKTHMEQTARGIKPKNADVMRYALFLAVDQITPAPDKVGS